MTLSATHTPIFTTCLEIAQKNIQDILSLAICYSPSQQAVVVMDQDSPVAKTLTEAYRRCLPSAVFIDFNATTPDEILALFKTLQKNDLVVLIQSTNFRLKDFRIRVELFEQFIKVIEHPYLGRMQGMEEKYYIDSLAYDPRYYHRVGHQLKNLIDQTTTATIISDTHKLIFNSKLEPAKLNIGDYRGMKNIGGQFPIGEVFTEAVDLEQVNGSVAIFAFTNNLFCVIKPSQPIILIIQKGRVTDVNHSTVEFDQVLDKIRADEGQVWVRELGFGLNTAFSSERMVKDVGTYERMCGMHLSLGSKHSVYKKPIFKRGTTWHHVDVFVVTDEVYLDEHLIFENSLLKL